ncbi:MAG: hypothetical protein P1P82_10995 [Bacteroidales bacterium]|nr:hypothetical protein [Bacteroidales bacterium]MDT8432244.1 hypothetical protein [Bacteroidales bacterium]
MEIRKFRSSYGLELITASHAGITLGDLVWDSLSGKVEFSHPGMPNTIYSAFLDAGLIDKKEFAIFQEECSESELTDALLAERNVDVRSELIAELKHPSLGKIEGNFRLDSISKFTFGNLQVKLMDDLLRVNIDRYLEEMKANKWKEYDGRIRRVNMITELYYGSIRLVVEKSLSSNLDAAMEKGGITALTRTEGSRSVEYAFAHENVPFAMRIEKVRRFNG